MINSMDLKKRSYIVTLAILNCGRFRARLMCEFSPCIEKQLFIVADKKTTFIKTKDLQLAVDCLNDLEKKYGSMCPDRSERSLV